MDDIEVFKKNFSYLMNFPSRNFRTLEGKKKRKLIRGGGRRLCGINTAKGWSQFSRKLLRKYLHSYSIQQE